MAAARLESVTPSYSLLITDDDDLWRESLGDAFAQTGYDTLLASCGHEAIEIVRHHLIHVAILDMQMPDLTGLETLRLIRREVESPLPCIFMSAGASKELRLKALAADVVSFIEKPVNVGMVREVVSDVIRKYYRN